MLVMPRNCDFEELNYGASWTNEELALGFVGDVGNLVKADVHGVNLEDAFLRTMDDLENHIKQNLAAE